eukprot:CAMPEP_0198652612 /NCGR_PEP_ID=MMETSP1467-20131203/6508_1 /TAXON_ID=1462469 /ORGANISM="unid. sp., Strain CCMP2135" /LENGTH=351 /DNA_ID=CAMNT_0044388545 /DNA_START=16 /DNA_END=1069 /DNA_ORIENTATION=+
MESNSSLVLDQRPSQTPIEGLGTALSSSVGILPVSIPRTRSSMHMPDDDVSSSSSVDLNFECHVLTNSGDKHILCYEDFRRKGYRQHTDPVTDVEYLFNPRNQHRINLIRRIGLLFILLAVRPTTAIRNSGTSVTARERQVARDRSLHAPCEEITLMNATTFDPMMFIASTTMTVHHDCSLALQHSQMTAAAYATITQASFQAANNMDFGFALQPVSNDVIALYGGVPYPSKSLANAANSTSVHDQLAVLMYSVGCHPGNTLSWACEVLPYQCSSTTVGPRDVFFDLLHQRCGHYHDGYLHMLPKLTIGCPPIKPGSKTSFCPGCALGSHQRSSVHGAAIPRAVLPFLTIW